MSRPPYDRASSDGCSVPRALRLFIPCETAEQREGCVDHDESYYYGGSRRRRAIADATLLLWMLTHDMDVDLAHEYHLGVRAGGKSHWNDGDGVQGRYSDDPPPAEMPTRDGDVVQAP